MGIGNRSPKSYHSQPGSFHRHLVNKPFRRRNSYLFLKLAGVGFPLDFFLLLRLYFGCTINQEGTDTWRRTWRHADKTIRPAYGACTSRATTAPRAEEIPDEP